MRKRAAAARGRLEVHAAGRARSSGGGFTRTAATKPPGCGQKDDGSFCDCVDVPLFAEAPNIYFVLDRSGSMAEDNKWGQVRQIVAQILRGLGPRANFGATLFPGFDDSPRARLPSRRSRSAPAIRPAPGRADDEEAPHRDAEPAQRRHADGRGASQRPSAASAPRRASRS